MNELRERVVNALFAMCTEPDFIRAAYQCLESESPDIVGLADMPQLQDTVNHLISLISAEARKQEREDRKHLINLSRECFIFLRQLDKVMKRKDGAERGKLTASISNNLEMANDKVRYFALGVDYRKDDKDKEYQTLLKEGGKEAE